MGTPPEHAALNERPLSTLKRHSRPTHTDSLVNAISTPTPITSTSPSPPSSQPPPQLTALQQHILFFDRDNDGIIYPLDIYRSFRSLGFNIPFSFLSLLIPFFFSYATTLPHSWFPDPFFRIYVSSIHKAKHGSDTGVFDIDGNFDAARFDEIFDRYDKSKSGGLSADELWAMWRRNRCAADLAGWTFAWMELVTTWLLLQREGRVWKEDLRSCYDGSVFWRISEFNKTKGGWKQGYGVKELLDELYRSGTWKNWWVKEKELGPGK
ncbi:uncharacterized protein Z518_03051 [Rhinocladiella mackenziei CBS 650.93]|uniref:EF-hand domain-containing protein n=1 Tax=Rhinocladiella mackenziei CBS 650.93 TaxID=1442369 RepID=A0A0D2JGD1_9EURO|nr:uncharacterized protein Z518_03051 [Rhinocladiella mackenziei CBS 650.93]KIX08395.1 hypothetical protein Z518_03051 [Rhinocladiella mackenziei CBS 650.93]